MIVPSAEPVTGTTFTSMSGIGPSSPGSGIFVNTLATRPSMPKRRSVPRGEVSRTDSPSVNAAPSRRQTSACASKSVSRSAELVMIASV